MRVGITVLAVLCLVALSSTLCQGQLPGLFPSVGSGFLEGDLANGLSGSSGRPIGGGGGGGFGAVQRGDFGGFQGVLRGLVPPSPSPVPVSPPASPSSMTTTDSTSSTSTSPPAPAATPTGGGGGSPSSCSSTQTLLVGVCVNCKDRIDGCTTCRTETDNTVTCTGCLDGTMLDENTNMCNVDQGGCAGIVPGCAPNRYVLADHKVQCNRCRNRFAPDEGLPTMTCIPCDVINNCRRCDDVPNSPVSDPVAEGDIT